MYVGNVWVFRRLFVFSLGTVVRNVAEMFRVLFELLNVTECISRAKILFAYSEKLSKSFYTFKNSKFELWKFPPFTRPTLSITKSTSNDSFPRTIQRSHSFFNRTTGEIHTKPTRTQTIFTSVVACMSTAISSGTLLPPGTWQGGSSLRVGDHRSSWHSGPRWIWVTSHRSRRRKESSLWVSMMNVGINFGRIRFRLFDVLILVWDDWVFRFRVWESLLIRRGEIIMVFVRSFLVSSVYRIGLCL